MSAIKFGTDGWRAVIADEFTLDNVARISEGVAQWILKNPVNKRVVIGYDCRFGGQLFSETVAKVLLKNNIEVYLADTFVSTPMLSLAVLELKCGLGVVITASHNPPSYNGYKLKGAHGGPLNMDKIIEVESFIPHEADATYKQIDLATYKKAGSFKSIDLNSMYIQRVKQGFDFDLIQNSGLHIAYDAMYGSGQAVMQQLLPKAKLFRCEWNPHFYGISPEPILKNLSATVAWAKQQKNLDAILINDGDADRIGLMLGSGEYIDSHHIMLLLIHYLCKYKAMKAKVVTGFSTTLKMQKLCAHYGLDLEIVPIGFKHISEIMQKEDVLMGGEESGGIAVKGHIPERDGIWNGLVLFEAMAKTGKNIKQLIDEVYAITGAFAFKRIDLSMSEAQKQSIITQCKADAYKSFGNYKVLKRESLDGYKFYFSEHSWGMIRPSGTEPLLRTYAEGETEKEAEDILKQMHKVMLQ
jgi:phosphomannomutase